MSSLLLENADNVLLESADGLLLEDVGVVVTAVPGSATASALAPVAGDRESPTAAHATASPPHPIPKVRVTIPRGSATASRPAPLPGISVGKIIRATASVPLPSVSFDAHFTAPVGKATASAPVPGRRIVEAAALRQNPATFGGVYFGQGTLGGQEGALEAANATASAPAPGLVITLAPVLVPPARATASRPVPLPKIGIGVPRGAATASIAVPVLSISEGIVLPSNLPTKLRFSYRRRLAFSYRRTLVLDPGATNLVHDAPEMELALDG